MCKGAVIIMAVSARNGHASNRGEDQALAGLPSVVIVAKRYSHTYIVPPENHEIQPIPKVYN